MKSKSTTTEKHYLSKINSTTSSFSVKKNFFMIDQWAFDQSTKYGLDWIGLDWIGLDWIGLEVTFFQSRNDFLEWSTTAFAK